MKRKDETVNDPKTKKLKKSVNFSTEVDGNNVSNNNPKTLKLGKTFGTGNKKEKKGKFEKPTKAKKLDKIDKAKHFENTTKSSKLSAKTHGKTIKGKSETTEKPNWTEFKKQKKELKEKRKAKRLTSVYDVTVKAKKIGENLRRADCPAEKRVELTTELHEVLKGQYAKMVLTHDMARIIQWQIKYCNPEIRESIASELKPCIVSMFQSNYAKNCIKKLLKKGSDEIRANIISACYGNVVKLASHIISAPLVEFAFSSWASELNKIHFKQEFYGDMYKQAKDNNVKTLADAYKSSEDMKSATLSATKGNLIRILNKKLINTTLVHSVLLEFLTNCSTEDRNEIIVMLRSLIVELSKTKDGTNCAMICLWHGTNKDRKIAMKALKDEVKNVATSEYGYMIFLALFDCIDDTVLLKKMLLAELQSNLTEIALNEYGRRLVLYLVARRDPHYFHPAIVDQLKQGDGNAMSKKPAETREKELLEAVIDKFLETIATEATMWLSNSSISMVTLAILKSGRGEKLKSAFEAIAQYITDPDSKITEGEEKFEVVEHSGLHMMLKRLIQNDKNFAERGKITFGEVLIERLEREVIDHWIEFNRGCFLLVLLVENGTEPVVSTLISKLKPLSKVLKSKKNPGASILLKKINSNDVK